MIPEKISNKTSNRFHAITQKVDGDLTGQRESMYVHVDFDVGGKPNCVSFSTKKKDDVGLDKILTALGDAVTSIIREGLV